MNEMSLNQNGQLLMHAEQTLLFILETEHATRSFCVRPLVEREENLNELFLEENEI